MKVESSVRSIYHMFVGNRVNSRTVYVSFMYRYRLQLNDIILHILLLSFQIQLFPVIKSFIKAPLAAICMTK